jgi:oligopeptide transport system ATP-binding protein
MLLEVHDLRVQFKTDDGVVRAVDGVSFALSAGETLGIVGESGSGKSVTSLALLGLVPQPPGKVTSGQAMYRGQDLLRMSARQLASIRGNRIAMIFQDPMTALNPFLTIEQQLTEVTRLHLGHNRRTALAHAVDMLERVGIPSAERRIFDYPHQFSGGMRQRVMIAMALACKPDVLIADEPTTALDVTIQAQILELMKKLQRDEGTAIVMITHDLGIIANIAHRVNVMYAGRIVEESDVDTLFARPRHPYTLGLLRSIPRLDVPVDAVPVDAVEAIESAVALESSAVLASSGSRRRGPARLTPIDGQPPDLAHLPPGCAFAPRCAYRVARCTDLVPPLVPAPEGGRYACLVDVTAGSGG